MAAGCRRVDVLPGVPAAEAASGGAAAARPAGSEVAAALGGGFATGFAEALLRRGGGPRASGLSDSRELLSCKLLSSVLAAALSTATLGHFRLQCPVRPHLTHRLLATGSGVVSASGGVGAAAAMPAGRRPRRRASSCCGGPRSPTGDVLLLSGCLRSAALPPACADRRSSPERPPAPASGCQRLRGRSASWPARSLGRDGGGKRSPEPEPEPRAPLSWARLPAVSRSRLRSLCREFGWWRRSGSWPRRLSRSSRWSA